MTRQVVLRLAQLLARRLLAIPWEFGLELQKARLMAFQKDGVKVTRRALR